MVAWNTNVLYVTELRKATKLLPVLFHLINIEIDLQCANPKPSSISSQPTNQPSYLSEIGPRLLQVWFLVLPILLNMKNLEPSAINLEFYPNFYRLVLVSRSWNLRTWLARQDGFIEIIQLAFWSCIYLNIRTMISQSREVFFPVSQECCFLGIINNLHKEQIHTFF